MSEFLSFVLAVTSLFAWNPEIDPDFAPQEAEIIRASIADLERCYPQAYLSGALYVDSIVRIGGMMNYASGRTVHISIEQLDVPLPRVRTIALDGVLAHESRHAWQLDPIDGSQAFVDDVDLAERDAVKFELPVYDLCMPPDPSADEIDAVEYRRQFAIKYAQQPHPRAVPVLPPGP